MNEEELQLTLSIVLFENKATEIKELVSTILKSTLKLKIFLIDNSKTDRLSASLADLLSISNIKYTFNDVNLGFGVAHNIAIRNAINAGSPYHLVINPDIAFQDSILEYLFKYMEDRPDIGLVMPKIIYPNGELQYSCKLIPTPSDLIFRRFLPSAFTKKRIEYFEMRSTGYDKEIEVPYLSGCFMFLRTEALKKVGLFDERFFMYPEDIDLTRRINKEYKTIYNPAVSIVHEHAKGSYKTVRLLYIHITNMIKYFNKWGWIFDNERKKVNKRILSQLKQIN